MKTKTTIAIEEETRNKLLLLGRKGQTYDDIILQLYYKATKSKP